MSKKTLEVKLSEAEAFAKRKDERVLIAKHDAKAAWTNVAEIKKMIEEVQQKQMMQKLSRSGLDIKAVCDFIDAHNQKIKNGNGGNSREREADENAQNNRQNKQQLPGKDVDLNPHCDTCEAEMYLKEWNGKKFWACPNWQKGDDGHKTKPYR